MGKGGKGGGGWMRGGREDTKIMAGRAPLAMQFRGSGDGHSGDEAEYRGRIRVR